LGGADVTTAYNNPGGINGTSGYSNLPSPRDLQEFGFAGASVQSLNLDSTPSWQPEATKATLPGHLLLQSNALPPDNQFFKQQQQQQVRQTLATAANWRFCFSAVVVAAVSMLTKELHTGRGQHLQYTVCNCSLCRIQLGLGFQHVLPRVCMSCPLMFTFLRLFLLLTLLTPLVLCCPTFHTASLFPPSSFQPSSSSPAQGNCCPSCKLPPCSA
jgi:hypothetical protein